MGTGVCIVDGSVYQSDKSTTVAVSSILSDSDVIVKKRCLL